MTQATLQRFEILGNGKVKVTWEDGHSAIFENLQHVKNDVMTLETMTNTELLLLGWFLARQPDGSNVNVVEGKRLTLDLSASNPIRVQ